MENNFKINDQVVVRDRLNHGRNVMVRLGNILAFKGSDNEIAVVAISSANPRVSGANNGGVLKDFNKTRKEIHIKDLEKVSTKFAGRSVVHANPIFR